MKKKFPHSLFNSNFGKVLSIVLVLFVATTGNSQTERIVNGEPITIDEVPWQVWLGGCGASVISDEWVLTAAHCRPRTGSKLTFGQTMKNEGGTQTKTAKKVIIHPNYQSVSSGYDVALIQLDEPLDLSDPKVSKIRIATEKDKANGLTDPGTRVICTGWGQTSANGGSPNQLQMMDVPIVSDDDAKGEISQYNATSMLPTGTDGKNKSACYGDSGGPLAIKSEEGNILVGVVSWGKSCKGVSLFARVSTYAQWIFDNTGITEDPTGIESQSISDISLTLAPNPNNGTFNIIANNLTGSSMQVNAYDLQGKQIFSNQLSIAGGTTNNRVDFSHLNKGVYFLKVQADNGSATSRLVIR